MQEYRFMHFDKNGEVIWWELLSTSAFLAAVAVL
jgi:hypothetical protein